MRFNLNNRIDSALSNMHKNTGTDKGSHGELAVFGVCEQFYQSCGGILIHSFSYLVDKEQKGNIKKGENGALYVENLGDTTEIDILYVSPYKVFPIEVKAYKAKEIRLTDEGIYGCRKTDKSPVHQNEMHMRHLYSYLYRALPDGCTDFVHPIVCFVDKCTVVDERSDMQKEYITVCTLNDLSRVISTFNQPLDCKLDLSQVDRVLRECMVKYEKYLPVRL